MAIFKSNRRLNLLLLLSGTNCMGCKLKIIMQLYKQVLKSGAIARLSAPKTTLEKIQLVVQNKAIKIAYRLYQHPQNT